MWSVILLLDLFVCLLLSFADCLDLMTMRVSHFAMIILVAIMSMSKIGESNRKGKR